VVGNGASRWKPESEEGYESAKAELKERFAVWVAETGAAVDVEAPEGLLHYKWGYLDHHLTRWTRRDLDEIFLELYPAKVIAEPDELGELLAEAKAFVTFLSATALLDEESEPAEVLLGHLSGIEGQFRSNMADPSLYSFGKRLWAEAAAEGVRPGDTEAAMAFIERFNERPRAERDAVLGGRPERAGRRRAAGRITPPGTPPRPASRKRRKPRR
jgi:hypothetical protein